MKTIEEIKQDARIEILHCGIDGGSGIIHITGLRKCTVIWSYGGGWEHVSVNPKNRTPTWEEMCIIKDMFWNENECAVEYHPPKSDYINISPNCLHLWRPTTLSLPMPPMEFV